MLRTRIKDNLKQSMLSQDKATTSTLRLILAALKDRDISARSKGILDGISDQDALGLLQSMIKQRRESIELYEQAGRAELAQKEREEIAVIENFLPKQMDDNEIGSVVDSIIKELDATTLRDMGKVMGALKENHTGAMDFSKAGALVKTRLG